VSLLQLVVALGLVVLQLWAISMLVPLNGLSRSMLVITIMMVALLALLELFSLLTVMPSI
jgi:hypothetical protein